MRKVAEQWQDVVDTPPDVSRVIEHLSAGKCDASYLRLRLERAAQAIYDTDFAAGKMPARSDLREKLDAIEDAAMTIARLVLDPDIVNADPELHQAFGAPEGLDVPGAMARLLRLTDKVKRRLRRGRGSATSAPYFGHFSARLLCARIIVEAWRRLHNRPPNPNSGSPQQACAALWVAAGQKASARVQKGDVAEGVAWQRHLRNALKLDETSAIEMITRKVTSPDVLGAMVVERASAVFRDQCTQLPEVS